MQCLEIHGITSCLVVPFMNLLERPLGETPFLMGRSKCEASYDYRADFFEF